MGEEEGVGCRSVPMTAFPPTPLGLEALYSLCRRIYPDQVNPLQVTALVKYWLGGPDPLDYISMYTNSGDPEQNIPPHWHYISFGLSDLHGDGRVHDVSGPETPSGFGFELTFRLKREPGETAPPTWPAAVMQALAKYVFQSANTLFVGDNVSWHNALDNSESRIQHMLMTEDPQLGTAHTPFGLVKFVQIVGVCSVELQAAQHWNGPGVLEILKRLPGAGGPWLITDMRRGESMLELDPTTQEEVERGVETEGSNLSGVSARCSWADVNVQQLTPGALPGEGEGGILREGPATRPEPLNTSCISEQQSHQIKTALKKGLLNTKPILPPIGRSSNLDNNDNSYDHSSTNEFGVLESTELLRSKKLEGLHLTFNLEAGNLLFLAIRGRVMHGRHFTFKSVLGDTAITLVAPTVTGTLVDQEHPYVAHGPWLQVLIPDDLAQLISDSFEDLDNPEELILPKTFVWSDHKLAITIVEDK
ncbi:suppressor of fused homolog [Zootermopsis nevadensis]|uniref:Suppressor of fused homolog n=1 Tax=Zootermopsis nevadensis TaxID=136037 RepID=A0A067RET7_ZOONE|nr:suppressor of fused homolog [Zootermopsis nevadensis]KDR22406.1 Suppressor of fused-like protein [Zootermopsis nevadensis]